MRTQISPKVIVSVIVGIILTAVVSNLYAITPDMLDFLGPWKIFVFGTILTAISALAAWWKTDPLRTGYTPEDDTALKNPTPSTVIVNAPATAAEPATPAVSFAPTQERIDASSVQLPDVLQPTTPIK